MLKPKRYFITGLTCIILLLVFFGEELFGLITTHWGSAALIYSIVATVSGIYYSKNEKFYLFVHKYILFWFKDHHSRWKFFNRFEGVALNRKRAKEVITEELQNKDVKLEESLDNYLKFVEDDEVVYKFNIKQRKDSITIEFRTSKFTVPWSKYGEEISIYTDLFNRLSSRLNPEKSNYQISLYFEKRNPYFGFFIRYLPQEMVRNFTCNFRSNKTDESTISATKNKITINSKKTESLRRNAIDYLTLNDTLVTN